MDETDGSETILSVTASHPFYSQDREWVHASKLQVGEKLAEDEGGALTVTSVEFNPNAKTALTCNLTIGDYQTYFVGEDGVLVHNGRIAGRAAAFRRLFQDPNTPSFIKGWMRQELNRGRNFSNMRNPKGCDLGHHPTMPGKDGHGHTIWSRFEWIRDNRSRGGRFGR